MKKTRTAMLLLSSLFAMALVACGGNTEGDKKNSSQALDSTGENSSSVVEEASSFKVTFTQNYTGSPKPTQVVVEKGGTVERPADPTREGYTFSGWYEEKGCQNLFDFSTPIVKNKVLFAGWANTVLTVTYNFNYVGAPAMETVNIQAGATLTPIDDPTRENYSFIGWYLEASGDTKFDFSTPVQNDMTLYAKWALAVAVVTFDLNYTVEDQTWTEKVDVGNTLTVPTEPVRTGYDFKGWYLEAACDNAYDFTLAVNNNLKLYAKWEIQKFTVTFNYNYAGAENTSVTVEYGQTVEEPELKRSGYVGIWQLNGEDYVFSTPVTSDITLTAKWTAESSDSFKVIYYYNYTGAPNGGVYLEQTVKKNYKPQKPADPERKDYMFSGWYADAACTTPFNFDARLTTAGKEAYAKWLSIYTFEAEYVDLEGKMGFGFSVNLSGTDLIMKDNGTSQASNGYYVTGLYYEGAFIEFNINSNKAVDDAVVIMRVQAEYDDKTFNPDKFAVTVNDVSLDYDEFTITTLDEDSRSDDRRPFFDVQLNDLAVLEEGANVIRMTTTNDVTHGNTRKGDAPMIDCIYVASDAVLTWEPKTSNIK